MSLFSARNLPTSDGRRPRLDAGHRHHLHVGLCRSGLAGRPPITITAMITLLYHSPTVISDIPSPGSFLPASVVCR